MSKMHPILIIFFLTCLSCFIFFPFFDPNNLGHDYALFLPQLLNGYFHFIQNDLISIPWFSPATCGGIPFYPDMNNLYFSFPQFMSFFVNPIAALKITFFTFTFLGGLGFYTLISKRFEFGREVSLLAAALFVFNSLFASRMMIGHLTFHSVMLMPWLIHFILSDKILSFKKNIKESILASFCLSYMFYSGAIHLLVPTLIVALVVLLFKLLMFNEKPLWSKLFLVLTFTFLIVGSKLNAALNLMHYFPRDFYTLPGWSSFYHILSNIFISLFFHLDEKSAEVSYTNNQFTLGVHELEFSIGIVPFIILVVFLILRRKILIDFFRKLRKKDLCYLFLLLFLLSMPIFLNFYSPTWNHVLKSLPLVKNSALMVRWFVIYIPIFIILSMWALMSLSFSKKHIQLLTALAILITFIQTFFWNKKYYAEQGFQGQSVVDVWSQVNSTKKVPPIVSVVSSGPGNLTMINGQSNVMCYQPLFGYRLEKYPHKNITDGSLFLNPGETYNFKNPACYVFPKENNCEVGDHFRTSEKKQLELLSQYQSYEFKMPLRQKVANFLSLITLVFGVLFLIISFKPKIFDRFTVILNHSKKFDR